MSLLILNQKILYLVLLITLLYEITSATRNITIYVEEDGIDQSECMEGNESIPCHTLSYILNEINNDIFNGTNISVYVYITYSQEITNLSRINLLVNLYLIGVDNPILDFRGSHYVFPLQGGGCFYAESITFYAIWVSFYFLGTVSFHKCIFTSGDSTQADTEGLYIDNVYNLTISNCIFDNNDALSSLIEIEDVLIVEISGSEFYENKGQAYLILIGFKQVHNLTISNCLFHNNDAQSSLIEIEDALKVKISGSEFYQNKGQAYLISIGSEKVHNHTISNCLFHNNDAQSSLIGTDSVFNVKMSGCEFYENRGQYHLIFTYLIYIFDIDNCSIYDNDMNDVIFHLESTNSESIFSITNCLFSNNTSSGKILEIVSDRLFMSNINLISNRMKRIDCSIIQITSIIFSSGRHDIINMSNINFINNTGTGLKLKEATVYFNNITFYNNTGVYGGGMSLYHTRIYLTGPLIFESNTALFGGAFYIATTEIFLISYCTTFKQITFSSNFAGNFGADVYVEDGFLVSYIIYSTLPCINDIKRNDVRGDHIISGANEITINPQKNFTITLFPGQKLTYSAKVTDYFGNLTSCLVNIILECGNNFCKHVQLTGDAQSLLSTSNFTTNLYLSSNVEHHDHSINLQFLCLDTNAEAYANVNLTTCPLGYVFQTSQKSQPIRGTCECVVSDDVQCDFVLGVACIRHGYWFGKMNEDDVLDNTAPCQYPYCKTDLPPCPISKLSQTYNKLPLAPDEQCNGLYGGLLCRSCREDAVFSFEAVNCIPSSNCQPWQPYVTLVLVVAFQLALGFGIVIVLKASFKTGIGHLYGPLFFIAILRLIPFGYYKEYVQLELTASIFQSVLLLNLEGFGKVPWCFFSNINPLLNYSLHFLGPFIIAVVLLSTVLLARYYPRQFLSLQSSPIQAICLLILLSFWSVTDTCIQLLKPTTTLNGVKGWRVALQPNIQYLKDPYHIVTWIISTVLLIFLLVPFILLLLLSPLLRRKFNLTRIQPLLDAFQSCYHDTCRWYSGVYLLSWIILNINMPYYMTEIILIAVSTLHFMIHPYKYQWLNIVDTLLLVDLIMLVFLTSINSPNSIHKETVPISYILVVLPLTYITVGGVWIISVIIIKWCKCKVFTGEETTKEELVHLLEDDEEEQVVDSGDRDIHIGVSSTVVERPVCRRESLIFDDN